MTSTRVGIAADHGGFGLKEYLKDELGKKGFEVVDFGNAVLTPDDDYPDYVIPMAKAVASGDLYRGIAVCGSGVGACVAVNKLKGIRACLITESFSAHQGVEDDNMNIICLGGRVIDNKAGLQLTEIFLSSKFKNDERFSRRLNKITKLESDC